jgi:hypothetical protein
MRKTLVNVLELTIDAHSNERTAQLQAPRSSVREGENGDRALVAPIITPGDAADYIGNAFVQHGANVREITSAIAFILSRAEVSDWPESVSDDAAWDFWTRAHGDLLLALATANPNCGRQEYTMCRALMILIGNMPLPNHNPNSAYRFLERIGVRSFVRLNRRRLGNSMFLSEIAASVNRGLDGRDARSTQVLYCFPRNRDWMFPEIFPHRYSYPPPSTVWAYNRVLGYLPHNGAQELRPHHTDRRDQPLGAVVEESILTEAAPSSAPDLDSIIATWFAEGTNDVEQLQAQLMSLGLDEDTAGATAEIYRA